MEFLARVNPKYFAAINLFASVNDIRYYLNGIYIEPHPVNGAILVATDGHRMGVIHDPDGWCAKPIIVGGISKQLISACTKKSNIKTLTSSLYISERGAVVNECADKGQSVDPFSEFTTHLSKIEIIEAKYPDYRKVLPSKEDRSSRFPCVQQRYISALCKTAEILTEGSKFDSCIELFSSGRDTSLVARINYPDICDRFVGVIMPMRSDSPKSILPDWLMPETEAPTEPKAKPRYRHTANGFVLVTA